MSSKRRSYDTDEITLRKVFAKSFVNNSVIPAQRVLTADGAGGTYWAIPSTLGLNPSFNQINTTAGNFTADLSYNIFTLSAQTGIGFDIGSGSNELNIYGKAFNQIDVSGNNSLYGFTDNVVTPSVKFAGAGGITIYSNPQTNLITFDAQGTQVSSSLFSFQKAQVFSNASTITGDITKVNSIILNAASPSSTLGYVGLGDIRLFTNATSNLIYFDLKQSTGTISTIYGFYSTIIRNVLPSTVGGLGAAGYISSLSTTNLSTTNVFTSTITFNDINTNDKQILAVSSGILTLNGQGIQGAGDVTYGNLISTVTGLGSVGYISSSQLTSTTQGIYDYFIDYSELASTVTGLGTAGYLSSLSSQVISTGVVYSTRSIVSTVNFKDTNGNEYNLASSNASLYFNGTLVGSGSVTNIFNTSTYIYQVSTVSTLYAYATTVNISTVQTQILSPEYFSTLFFSTGNLLLSSASFKDTTTNATQLLAVKDGILQLNGTSFPTTPNLVSTVANLSQAGYVSSSQLVSTVIGLGTAGYLSTSQLISTVANLGTIGYISSSQLVSTTGGLLTSRQIQIVSTTAGINTLLLSTTAGLTSNLDNGLVSSLDGLATFGYISTSQLISSIEGLGTYGYISSPTLISSIETGLVSTVIGLGTVGYISTPSLISSVEKGLVSTVTGLGTAGYLSTTSLYSSIAGLGTAGYISSSQLISTVAGIGLGGVTKIVAGSNITISPTSGLGEVTINGQSGGGGGGTSFTAFSTVLISSVSTLVNPTSVRLSYLGFSTATSNIMGNTIYLSTGNRYSEMSSVQFKIDTFSSYIRSSANLYVGLQYNYLFSYWKGPDYINDNSSPPNTTDFIKPFVGFSTTLLLGNTPGNYIFEEYTPSLATSAGIQFSNDAGGPSPSPQTANVYSSNSYYRNQMFELPKTSFENLYRSTFSLYHVLAFGLQAPGFYSGVFPLGFKMFSGTSGFSSPTVSVDVGSNNPITLYVTN